MACLDPAVRRSNLCEAYAILKHWYRHASVCVPNPSWADMEKVTGFFWTLYQKEELQPLGIPLTTHMDPVQFNYPKPLKAEVEAAFRCLRPFKAGGHTHIRAENFKQWLW